MTPGEVAGRVEVRLGDCRDILRAMPDDSVNCVVTSPPYWANQRDYGHEGQIGTEATPQTFVSRLVEIFEEVYRVLHEDGVLWLNIGDTYASGGRGGGGSLMASRSLQWGHRAGLKGWRAAPPGFKQKDLVGVPWMLANALRVNGWTLRRDVVWDKGSATEPTRSDRPSGSHEMLFLFSKSLRYWFDASVLPHGSVWRVSPKGHPGHPAAFPEALVEPCVRAGCPVDGIVLDPFAGSGTVGVVAARTGRQSILIDINPAYAEIAEARAALRALQDAQDGGA